MSWVRGLRECVADEVGHRWSPCQEAVDSTVISLGNDQEIGSRRRNPVKCLRLAQGDNWICGAVDQ